MPISLYDATVPAFLQVLPALSGMLDKAEAHCRAAALPDTALTEATLAPDMWPFARQITAACFHSADSIVGTMAGMTSPSFAPPPTDFATLKTRIADAIAVLRKVDRSAVDAVADKDTCFKIGERQMDFTGQDYLLSFAMPNFYFHAAAAYAVLRANGVAVAKGDFLGQIRMKAPATA